MSLINSSSLNFNSKNMSGYVADLDTRYGITVDGSNNVTQWDEKFSNGMSFSAVSNFPVYTPNSLGILPSVNFNGTTSNLNGNTSAKSIIKNTGAYTVYALSRNTFISNGYILYASTNGSASTTRALVGTGNSASQMFSGGRIGDTGSAGAVNGPRVDLPYPYWSTFVIDNTNAKGYQFRDGILIAQNNSLLSSGSIPNTDSNSVCIGSLNGTTGWYGGDLYRLIVCNGAHTQSQIYNYLDGLNSQYLGIELPIAATKPSILVQFFGDSMTQGNINAIGTKTLPIRVWESLGSNQYISVLNIGWSGALASTVNTNLTNYANIVSLSNSFKNIIIIFVGFNDINAGTSGSTTYGTIKTGFQAAQSARPGVKVIVCTPISWNGTGTTSAKQTQLVALRTQINTNAVADGANAVCDFGAISQFDVTDQTKANNTTYYNADKLHPTDAGNLILASALATTINSV